MQSKYWVGYLVSVVVLAFSLPSDISFWRLCGILLSTLVANDMWDFALGRRTPSWEKD